MSQKKTHQYMVSFKQQRGSVAKLGYYLNSDNDNNNGTDQDYVKHFTYTLSHYLI